jgi:hypothetical protein
MRGTASSMLFVTLHSAAKGVNYAMQLMACDPCGCGNDIGAHTNITAHREDQRANQGQLHPLRIAGVGYWVVVTLFAANITYQSLALVPAGGKDELEKSTADHAGKRVPEGGTDDSKRLSGGPAKGEAVGSGDDDLSNTNLTGQWLGVIFYNIL